MSDQPRWARPIIPFVWAYWPVSRHARLAEQVDAAQNARRNATPSSASRWMRGVSTAAP